MGCRCDGKRQRAVRPAPLHLRCAGQRPLLHPAATALLCSITGGTVRKTGSAATGVRRNSRRRRG